MAAAGPGIEAGTLVGRPPSRALLWSLAVAACAGCVVSALVIVDGDTRDAPGVHAALLNWVTITYCIAGLAAWSRRPANRLGVLMIAAGAMNFIVSLGSSRAAVPYTIGIVFDLTLSVLLLHVFLAFPDGRLEGRAERGLVGVGYLTAFGAQLVGMALGGFGPDNLLAVVDEPETAYELLRGQLIVLSALLVTGAGVLLARRRRVGRPVRRWLALLVDSFALGLVMVAFLFLLGGLGMITGQFAFELIRHVTFFVIGLAPIAFLFALLDARLARSAVGEILVELGANPPPGELRDALARALRDPSLSLVFWLPEFGTWADVDGRAAQPPGAVADRAVTMIDRDGEHVAALLHDRWLEDERELLEAVAAAAAIALENARLHADLRARLKDLKGSRARLVEAGDAERRRLERNLHDGAQQRMIAVALQLRLAKSRIREDPAAAEALMTTAGEEVAHSLAELRELARGIHPAVLEHGLVPALDALAARSAIPVTVSFDTRDRLPERVELAAYFVASEALANVAKYAQASAVTMSVRRTGGLARIEIADDGIGGADDARGSGLRGLADRVEALDGRLRVRSPAGAGTVVTAEVPCAS